MPAGRPPIWSTPEELQAAVDKYFADCERSGNPKYKTITGLALALGFNSRGTIYEYEKKREFSDIIKRAMLEVENAFEIRCGYGNAPTGPIFVLKNMGWKDKTEQELSGGLQITRVELPAKKPVGSVVDL